MFRSSFKYILVLLLVLSIGAYGQEYFTIENYIVDIKVNENNSYNIQEELLVNFDTERHGIYRDIPSTYNGKNVKIDNIAVKGSPFKKLRSGSNTRIKIGDPYRFVLGEKKYIISYDYTVGDDGNKKMDEFYHNIIGDRWDTTIKKVKFTIEMPSDFDKSKVNFTSGIRGSTDSSGIDYRIEKNTISGETLKPLGPREALTIALPLPEGYYRNTSKFNGPLDVLYYLKKWAGILFLTIISFVWFFFGRDKKIIESVEFYPPEGITPAEAGYMIDGSVDTKDVTSLLFYWAEKGYIEIEEEETNGMIKMLLGKDYTFIKLKDRRDAPYYETMMFNELFYKYGDGEKVKLSSLRNNFYKITNKVKSIIKKHKSLKTQTLYTNNSKNLSAFMKVLAILPVFLESYTRFYLLTGDLYISIPFAGAISLLIYGVTEKTVKFIMNFEVKREDMKLRLSRKIMNIIPFLVILFVSFNIFRIANLSIVFNIVEFVIKAIIFIISFILAEFTLKRTEYSTEVLGKLKGFRNFLIHAEKNRLETLVKKNPQYYYNILPYAIVLGVTNVWADKFDGIASKPPRWYRGYRGFTTHSFIREINQSVNSIGNTMSSRPGSSSSSGGSSGGGSGGGGGGSW
ncbi:DUF2207 domain-containing protein [Ilyobacter polytropus]|uniref:Transmembrane signal peptide protein n=1 Tax=Ilyobacter polytropus (strain ATCC 51220 / DSM 2926 / LMG 16218 / CuHBu1) TaxID=572544 RepID=E3H760_ILYPC|nr:DUF2207 domain-containing protein [Ilyobacter polytropus]ADO82541.1 Protein of unknown function DUF2207, membrane [Ilyobacter polytropus DSM 2926]